MVGNANISLRDAVMAWSEMLDMQLQEEDTTPEEPPTLTQQQDVLLWRWESSAVYSAKSVYRILTSGGRIKWQFLTIWAIKIPFTVRVFAYLLIEGKLPTHDVMERRFIQCMMDCVLCTACQSETALHLFFMCTYSKRV